MAETSTVLIRDPHRPGDVFAAACQAAGSSPDEPYADAAGGACMLMARGGQRASALVSVHYAGTGPDGRVTGLYPQEQHGSPLPDCYSCVMLATGSFAGDDEVWQHHARLVRQLGTVLDSLRLRWCWQFQAGGGPWLTVVPATRKAALAGKGARR